MITTPTIRDILIDNIHTQLQEWAKAHPFYEINYSPEFHHIAFFRTIYNPNRDYTASISLYTNHIAIANWTTIPAPTYTHYEYHTAPIDTLVEIMTEGL